jgi:hypothetical protein
MLRRVAVALGVVAVAAAFTSAASAHHSWGKYHWARTSNPFTLQLGNNLSGGWGSYLGVASSDWSLSSVLDTTLTSGGTNGATCAPTLGRIEVCNAAYGETGWLGVAQIWTTRGAHIAQGTAKMNDTYFSRSPYNTNSWRQLVICQEVAHDFGLDHQDENFGNPNLGTCMDYTSNPDGPPSNLHPNAHDYEQLEIIYSHLDRFSTVGASATQSSAATRGSAPQRVERFDRISYSYIVRHYADGSRSVTHITWALP